MNISRIFSKKKKSTNTVNSQRAFTHLTNDDIALVTGGSNQATADLSTEIPTLYPIVEVDDVDPR